MAILSLAHRTSGQLGESFVVNFFPTPIDAGFFSLKYVWHFSLQKNPWDIQRISSNKGEKFQDDQPTTRVPSSWNRSRSEVENFHFHWIRPSSGREKIVGILYHHIFWGSEHPWGKMHPPPFVEWDAFGPSRNDGWWVVICGTVENTACEEYHKRTKVRLRPAMRPAWSLFSTMYEHPFNTSMCDRIL